MRDITTHYDGHGLNESIGVQAVDEPGPGGANHQYRFTAPYGDSRAQVGYIQFQYGPRNEDGSIAGVTEGAVLAVLIDRLEAFQAGPYACEENYRVLDALRGALQWTKFRADARAKRGVLGTTEV